MRAPADDGWNAAKEARKAALKARRDDLMRERGIDAMAALAAVMAEINAGVAQPEGGQARGHAARDA